MILLKGAATSGGPKVFGVSTVEFVGAAIGTTSATLPAHLAGDLIIGFASNFSSITIPSDPVGWTSITSGGTGLDPDYYIRRVSWRVAVDSSTVSGTWSNADVTLFVVLRGQLSVGTPLKFLAPVVGGTGKTGTLVYGHFNAFAETDRTSSLLFMASRESTATAFDTSPRWCTREWSGNSGSNRGVIHLSDAGLANYPNSEVVISGGINYMIMPIEIKSEP